MPSTQPVHGVDHPRPVSHPKKFREDLVAVARRGDAPIGQKDGIDRIEALRYCARPMA
jgi:hypothetical protein